MFFIRNFIFLLLAGVSVISFADEGLPIKLYSERHRTEWNWVEYRISLTNRSGIPILNPEIRYFAENSFIQYCENHVNDVNCSATRYGDYARDSVLTVAVDNVDGPLAVTSSVFPDWKYTVMKFKGTGLLYPDRTVRINFRVYRKDWRAWDCRRDWSYQKDAGVVEPNYFMAVYDASSTLLWGNDPTNGKRNSDVVLWSDRSGNSAIGAFDGNAAATVPAGRFWMLKDIPLSAKERRLLAGIGIHKRDAGRHQGKSLLLFKADSAVRKGELDSLVGGFYNALATDDTTRLKVDFLPEDQIKEETVCDSLGNCQRGVSVRTEFDMETGCWPDVSMHHGFGKGWGRSAWRASSSIRVKSPMRGNVRLRQSCSRSGRATRTRPPSSFTRTTMSSRPTRSRNGQRRRSNRRSSTDASAAAAPMTTRVSSSRCGAACGT